MRGNRYFWLAALAAAIPSLASAQTDCRWVGNVWRCQPNAVTPAPRIEQFDVRPLLRQHQEMRGRRDERTSAPQSILPDAPEQMRPIADAISRQIVVDLITTGHCDRAINVALQTRDLVFAKEAADFCRDFPKGATAK